MVWIVTVDLVPILWALSHACSLSALVQGSSKKITSVAAVSVIPTPAAFVVQMITLQVSSVLNLLIQLCRSASATSPVNGLLRKSQLYRILDEYK